MRGEIVLEVGMQVYICGSSKMRLLHAKTSLCLSFFALLLPPKFHKVVVLYLLSCTSLGFAILSCGGVYPPISKI